MRCIDVTGPYWIPRDGLTAPVALMAQQSGGFLTRIRCWPEQRRQRRELAQLERAIRENGVAWLADTDCELHQTVRSAH